MSDIPLPTTNAPTGASIPEQLARLHGEQSGARLWRSLDELAGTPAFQRWADAEFPALQEELETSGGQSRRTLLKVMAASLALVGLSACRRPEHVIHAYGETPPEVTPGVATYYATTTFVGDMPVGILAESHTGRPTKLEGNPLHPVSLGKLGAFGQAEVLDLYDPDRSRFPRRGTQPVPFEPNVSGALDGLRDEAQANGGEGLALLIEHDRSPSLRRLLGILKQRFPKARIYRDGVARTDGASVSPRYDLAGRRTILAIDSDLLGATHADTQVFQDYAAGRNPDAPAEKRNRLYVAEPHFTVTGMAADHRLRIRAAQGTDLLIVLAARILGDQAAPALRTQAAALGTAFDARLVEALAEDLVAAGTQACIAVGNRQPTLAHALAAAIHAHLGAAPLRWEAAPAYDGYVPELVAAMRADNVKSLLLLGTNPVYSAPGGLDFEAAFAQVPNRVHLSERFDETSAQATWHVPRAHPLEAWGDGRIEGHLSAVQPLIAPIFGGRTELEILARLLGEQVTDPYAITRETFGALSGDGGAAAWKRHLNRGVTEIPQVDGRSFSGPGYDLDALLAAHRPASTDGIELAFALDSSVADGRYANNRWLQETPDPITKLTWDNAAWIAPATARRLGVSTGDVLRVRAGGADIEIPALIVPGSVEDSLQLALGYGRSRGGSLAKHAGVDVNPLRDAQAPWIARAEQVERTDATHQLATTQEHWAIETHEELDGTLADRALVRQGTQTEYEADPTFAQHQGIHIPHHKNIGETPQFTGEHQWGMSIELSTCIGCTACQVACQSENNVPIVGRDEVLLGREMSWIRMDRYFRGEDPEGEVTAETQPMLCQHCENAPCETVCPVNATVHDQDGLNTMTYNRCVGTRYCSNNCPYKVRRFNFSDYGKDTLRKSDAPFDGDLAPNPTDGLTQPQIFQPDPTQLGAMQKNPDVTVRMRGVMEKCTFCVQRIQRAKIDTKIEAGQSRAALVVDGSLKTACQQACPTDAIVFGNIRDPESRVSKLRDNPRRYDVLGHLNTRPRVTYLARIKNPNPKLIDWPAATTGKGAGS